MFLYVKDDAITTQCDESPESFDAVVLDRAVFAVVEVNA